MLTRIKERAEEAPLRSEALRGSEANFRTLAETIASPIFIIRGKNLHYVNHAAEVITGYSREEILSIGFCDLLHPDTREPALIPGRVHQEEFGLVSRCEVKILTKNHEERWLEITAATIEFDGELASLFSAFDLTERKRVEEQAQLLAVTDPLTGFGQLPPAPGRPPRRDRTIRAHGTTVCRSAARLGWPEEDQRRLRSLGCGTARSW
jgi:PAS domain S-box-containing protein